MTETTGAVPSVAVIGLAGRFPGASNVQEFWENIRDGRESITTFSVEEMVAGGVDTREATATNYVPVRGVAPDLDKFDAPFFGYTPREAELMDPQHRVFLECAWEALESCGIVPEEYEGAIGVYGGSSISTYLINNVAPVLGGLGAGAIQAAMANDKDHVPTRVSYKLNLRGPSVNVQTACSTSLVATHLACQSLLSGECDVALAGGASVTVPLKAGYSFAEGSILSPDGHCRAFDADAGGTVGGSGVAMVVLKRLEDAIEDGDPIHAVIRGSAINNDGSFKVGYTAPSVEGQAEVIAQAQAIADVEPDTVTYVEAHGTATQLGDPIEIAALTRAFRERTERTGFCAIGSLKTNIGHMDAAAGVAGLIKAVLAVEHGEIPPSLHYRAPNPQIDFAATPFYVADSLKPWETGGAPRRAGVSSFGIGGTNAHVILEEAPKLERGKDEAPPPYVLILSARNEAALSASAERLAMHLEAASTPLADVEHTLAVGRRAFSRRSYVVAPDRRVAIERLRALAREERPGETATAGRPVLFLFPGQGSQHVGMAKALYDSDPFFRSDMDACFEAARPFLETDLKDVVYPSDLDDAEAKSRLTDTRYAQPALFAVQYSLARLWARWGVKPASMIGHSIGEYAAACLAGVFSFEDAVRLVTTRGALMAAQPPGSMIVVPLPAGEVAGRLQGGLSVAAVNQEGLTVVSGPDDEIDELIAALEAEGLEARRLHTSHAFHSSMMDPALEPFETEVAGLERHAPRVPFVSCVTGEAITDHDATDPAYWARHLRDPVLFAEGLDAILKGHDDPVLVEVGPSQTLSALSRRHPGASVVVPTLPHARAPEDDAVEAATEALGRVWQAGGSVDWAEVLDGRGGRRVPLPTYPFQRERYWMDPGAARPSAVEDVDGKLDADRWLYAPVWRQAPRSGGLDPQALPDTWLILGAETSVGERLVAALQEFGATVVSVRSGGSFERLSNGEYRLPRGSLESYPALLDDLGRLPDVIVHAWASAEPGSGTGFDDELNSLLWLGRALAESDHEEDVRLAVIGDGLLDGPGGERPVPERAMLLGACRVLPQDVSNLSAVCVDAPSEMVVGWTDQDVHDLLADLVAVDPEPVIALRRRQRFVEAFEGLGVEPESDLLREGGAYVVFGGLGGVGLEVAGHLHSMCGARLLLTTRQPVDPEGGGRVVDESAMRGVDALRESGAQLRLVQADVTDAVSVEAALSTADAAYGGVDGVVFAVGAEKTPTPLEGLSAADVEGQLRVRVEGLSSLAAAMARRDADFCLIQSSLSSVLGASGFVAYAAAHTFMDAFAAAHDGAGRTRWLVVNWDNWITWKDEGAGIEDATDYVLTREEGKRAFSAALPALRRSPRVVVSTGSLERRRRKWINPRSESAPETTGSESSRYARPDTGTEYVAPRNDAESKLAEIWGDVLGIDGVGMDDDFFELGGDSVLGIQVVSKARKVGLQFSAQQIFELRTIASMAEAAQGRAPVDFDQSPISGPVGLNPIQEWFFERGDACPDHFNMPALFAAPSIDPDRFREALAAVVRHHDALRARFPLSDGKRSQEIDEPGGPVPVDSVDLSGLSADEVPEELARAAATHHARVDLEQSPLVRGVVFTTPAGMDDRALVIVHHLVVDAVSWRVLAEDLDAAYTALSRGQVVELTPKTTSVRDWAAALIEHAEAGKADSQLPFWKEHALDPVTPLPRDDADGANDMASTRSVRFELSEEETQALIHSVPSSFGTVDELLLAGLVEAVSGWSGSSEVRVAMEGHGREPVHPDLDASRTVGWFTSLYPLRFTRDGDASLADGMREVRETVRAVPLGGVGYGVLRYLAGSPEISDAPEPEISYLYLGRYRAADAGDGGGLLSVLREPTGANCDPGMPRPRLIDALFIVTGGRLELELGYSKNVHREATMKALGERVLSTVRELVSAAAQEGPAAADFPDAGLSQDQLNALLAGMKSKGA